MVGLVPPQPSSASDTGQGRSRASSSPELPEGRLSSHVLRGLRWKIASQSWQQVSRLVIAIVLARLLSPHDYGLAAMALVVASFIIPFADLGLGAALVQRRSIDEADRSTAFWVSVGSGLLITVVMILVSPFIADFYRNSAVGPLIAVISLSFFLTSLGATHRSLLVRSMDFRNLELRYVIASLVSGIVAIVVAAKGFGAWAFVSQELVLAVTSTVLVWIVVPWRPSFVIHRRSLRELGGFGGRALGGAFFVTLNRNTDNVLIGRYLGSTPLGLYSFSYNLMLTPLSRVVAPLQQVAFPAFSRLQDDPKKLASWWLRSNRLLAAVCVPPLIGIIITAQDSVPLVFGDQWLPAVPIIQVLCWVGILLCLQAMNDSILQASNEVTTYFYFMGALFRGQLGGIRDGFAVGHHRRRRGLCGVEFGNSGRVHRPRDAKAAHRGRNAHLDLWRRPRRFGGNGAVSHGSVDGIARRFRKSVHPRGSDARNSTARLLAAAVVESSGRLSRTARYPGSAEGESSGDRHGHREGCRYRRWRRWRRGMTIVDVSRRIRQAPYFAIKHGSGRRRDPRIGSCCARFQTPAVSIVSLTGEDTAGAIRMANSTVSSKNRFCVCSRITFDRVRSSWISVRTSASTPWWLENASGWLEGCSHSSRRVSRGR